MTHTAVHDPGFFDEYSRAGGYEYGFEVKTGTDTSAAQTSGGLPNSHTVQLYPVHQQYHEPDPIEVDLEHEDDELRGPTRVTVTHPALTPLLESVTPPWVTSAAVTPGGIGVWSPSVH